MVVFAPVNCKNTGGYFVASDQSSMGWCGVPHDLESEIQDIRQTGEEVKEVSIGVDGDWFLRTNRRRAWKTGCGYVGTSSNVELCHRHTERVVMGPYAIQSFTFVPDRTGYVAILHNESGSFTHCAWHNIPPKLAALLSREASKGVRRVVVGVNGSYVVLLNDGCLWWSGVPESLGQLLDNAQRTGRAVVTVSLSLISPSWYFVEFADGVTAYVLPQDWHAVIDKITTRAMGHTGPKVLSSSNSATSRSPLPLGHSPVDAQYGAFSPIGAHDLNARPSHGPFEPNQYIAPVLTLAQPAGTNIAYTRPCHTQQPQTASATRNYDSMLWIMGEVMDVLPSAQVGQGLGLGTGFGGY